MMGNRNTRRAHGFVSVPQRQTRSHILLRRVETCTLLELFAILWHATPVRDISTQYFSLPGVDCR